MSYPDELCKLVITHMEVIEEAPSVVEDVEKSLFKAINERVKERIEALNGWEGVYDFVTDISDEQTVFKPLNWPADEEEGYLAYYSLEALNEKQYYLSSAVGACSSQLIFWFVIEKDYDNRTPGIRKKYRTQAFNDKPALKEVGVVLEEGWLGIPFYLDPKVVGDEHPAFDECLKPLDEALDKLLNAHPIFDMLVKESKA